MELVEPLATAAGMVATADETASAPPVTVLDVRSVRKTYRAPGGPFNAVDGVDLTVRAGEIVALLGHNGAGKTTTIDMLLGLTVPSGGSITVFGQTPREAVDAGLVSTVLQTGGLLRDLTVRETVTAIAALHHCKERVPEVLEKTGLTALAKRKVSKCSGGEQQRLKFALALLPNPRLLVLDEPTAGMDVAARREFWDTMRQEARDGRTVIFATHYLEEAEAFAQRTILMGRGRILADRPTAELRGGFAGRTVTATLAGAGIADPRLAVLRAMAGVTAVELDRERVSVTGTESDAVALALLTELDGTALEIAAPTLEDAFLTLTEENR
ncbi:ABC transporter ATP-binding protein [Pseudarthrobacter sp. P1]|uniref:ABC transporter ATP-binding protein n=1 Tax=Pseudarthrobacter sp. P1 TaxID=3418418 RepID=UPI003CF55D3D